MQRKAQTLQLLKKRGEKGVTSEELSKKFGYESRNSSSKLIYLLRKEGHKISHDRSRGVFIFKTNGKVDQRTVKKDIPKVNTSGKTPSELLGIPPETKKGKIYNYLISKGPRGATPEELSSISGVTRKNICYQIHAIRNLGWKVIMIQGSYYIKGSDASRLPSYGSNSEPTVIGTTVSVDTSSILDKIGNKKLVIGLKKIRPEDQEAYLDLLKNVIYYTKCAESMLETVEMMEAVRLEAL